MSSRLTCQNIIEGLYKEEWRGKENEDAICFYKYREMFEIKDTSEVMSKR